MKNFLIRCGSVSIILSILCLMPALLLFLLGYEPRMTWNKTSIETECNVTSHVVEQSQCSESCNCRKTCTGTTNSRHCSRHCQTCYYTCYDSYITVEYKDESFSTFRSMILIENDKRRMDKLVNNLNKKYPLYNEITCYYNVDDPNQVKLKLYNPVGYMVGGILFLLFGGGLFIFYMVFEFNKSSSFHRL